ncbi:MAG TPA: tetratricopeptide repeat protein [bacterium]|nr:tetratricopeptide repeat protein [bacterium]
MKRTSGLLRAVTLLLIALELSGCAFFGGVSRETAQAEVRLLEQQMRDAYFSDWDAAVKSARAVLERETEGADVAQFIVGESLYLAGDHEAATPYLLAALRGRDTLAALAALQLIRDLYVSRPLAIELSRVDPSCVAALCRAVISSESLEWARATKRPWDARRQEEQLRHWSAFRLFRAADSSAFRDLAAVSAEENAYIAGTPLNPLDARAVELPDGLSAFDLRNYFFPVRNAVFFAAGEISLPEEATVTILPYITVPFRLYVDGKVVLERDADRLSVGLISGVARIDLAKGKHTILLKLAPYLSDDGYASLLFFNDGEEDQPSRDDDITATREGDDRLSAYLRLLARELLYADAGIADWEGFYASVNGSRSPGPLFHTARNYRRAGNDQSAGSILSFVARERPDLILIKSDLIEVYQDMGDDAALRRVVESEEGRERTELPWLLRMADLYFAKKWYAADIANAETLVQRYEDHPVAYYYSSDSWHAMGDIGKAARIRQKAVRLMPGYQPTLSRLAELYRESGDLSGIMRVVKQLVELDPHNIDHQRMLAEAYISDANWGKAARILRGALERNPEAADLWVRLGDALLLDGDKPAATIAFRRAYDLSPESQDYADRLDSVGAATAADLFIKQALADPAVDQKIAAFRKEAAKYPQKYTIIYDEGIQQIHYSGSVRSRFRMTIALNNDEGVREFSTVANYGRVLSARVVKLDGTSIPGWRADAANLYFLDTMPGDVIDFVMESSEGPRSWLGGTDFRWFFASEGVYNLHSRIVLRSPKDMPMLFHVRGPATETKADDADGVIRSFESFGLHQAPREEEMPPMVDELPMFSYTTVRSWDDLGRWQALFIRQQSDPSPDIERRVMDITQGIADPEKRVEVIRDWVARQVRYLSDDNGIDKVKPERTSRTFTEKAGDCKDKALLLKLMLEYAGIESRYALAKSLRFGSVIQELPSMQFDHALVYIPPQTGIPAGYFVDATSSYDHYRGINPELEKTAAFVVEEQKGGHAFVTVASGLQNTVSLTIKEDGAAQLSLTGSAASNGRYRFASDSDPFAYFSTLISKMAGAPVAVGQCALSGDQYAEPLVVACVAQPFFPALATTVLGRLAEAQERRYDIQLSDRISLWDARVSGIAVPPAPVTMENEFFVWRIAPDDGGALRATLELRAPAISSKDYPAFRAAAAAVIEQENKLRGTAP